MARIEHHPSSVFFIPSETPEIEDRRRRGVARIRREQQELERIRDIDVLGLYPNDVGKALDEVQSAIFLWE